MKHVKINVRLICVAAFAVLAVLLNIGCGERKAGRQAITTSTPQVTVEPGSKLPRQLSDVLADLEALPTPEGVDAALFQRLKYRLREELVERFGEKGVCMAPAEEEPRNEIHDLHYIGDEPGEVVNNRVIGMQWCYRNLGDYDQDGVVAIADITPLAIHYGESVPDDDNSIQAVLNGNEDEVINELDIIAMADNYGRRADYFGFRGSNDPEGPFDESNQWYTFHISWLNSYYEYDAKLRRQRLRKTISYTYDFRYWKVVAHDNMVGGDPHYGPLSNTVDMQLDVLGVGRMPPGGSGFTDYSDTILLRPGEESVYVGARKEGPGGDPELKAQDEYGWDWEGVLQYYWVFDDAISHFFPHPQAATPFVTATDQVGVYPDNHVWVSNGFAGDSFYFTIIVDNFPWIYDVTPRAGSPGTDVEFTASIDPPETEPDSYYWYFGGEDGWATPGWSTEAQPIVTLTDVLGSYPGSVTITAGEWEQTFEFDFTVGVAPDVATVEFEGWSDNPEFEGPLEGDVGTGANLKVIRHPGVEPPTPPVSYEWDIEGGVYPNVVTEADDSFEVMLVESGTYLGSVVITNDLGTADYYFAITVHKDRIYMYTFPPNAAATLSRDEPVRIVVAVEDLGHEWYKQITTVYYDDTIEIDSWNWGSPGGPGPGEPGDSDGIWQLVGVPNDLICSLGMGDGPRQAYGWMKVGGEDPPLDKWAFYRYLRPLGEFNEVARGSSGDVFNFNITLNAGIEPGDEPPDVTLEFLSVFFNLDLGESGQMFDATCYWDTTYHCPERFMDIGTGLTIPVTP